MLKMDKIFRCGEEFSGFKKYKVLVLFGLKFKKSVKAEMINGMNNKVYINTEEGQKLLSEKQIKKSNVDISVLGSNNLVELDESVLKNSKYLNLSINGNGNKVHIDYVKSILGSIEVSGNNHVIEIEKSNDMYLNIVEGSTCDHEGCYLKIGENCSCLGLSVFLYQNNTAVVVGKDCLFAQEVIMQSSDGHKIINNETGELLNQKPYKIEIGDHVWVGRRASILKNAKISSNSIVGYNAVVTGDFKQENVVIAGNPAKVVKQGINWDVDTVF